VAVSNKSFYDDDVDGDNIAVRFDLCGDMAWHTGNALCLINELTLHRACLVPGWVSLWHWAGKPA